MLITYRSQHGVGMMEVLVAMIILSIAILGFVALQVRATNATAEALKRSDALIVLNGLAEKIRLNSTGNYQATVPTTAPACIAALNCSANNQALADLYTQSSIAKLQNIVIGVVSCPNTSTNQARLCLIAAWESTSASIATTTTTGNACLTNTGKYADDAHCLVLEAY
ncbi:type IV pilus modification protein PilV [Acinetobacter wuhouensis]|uniref:type IV pilus modification protein PilV n=1 Tax=Acinetobacter wuhouensis TaxID=1879050 RepID=UPI0010230D83|nr:type IV pilus modification protein PilV [Acinetobacter wuhouensis]RZG72677.1 type IV pilus modification protein PilV [Acinetobacter wuhouensis]